MANYDILTQKIIEGMQERKGHDITVIDMTGIEDASTGTFVVCTGNTKIQVEALADSVREYVREQAGVKPFNYDGYANSEWIVIDYGSIYAHVFQPMARTRYNLEELWSDAAIEHIPDIY